MIFTTGYGLILGNIKYYMQGGQPENNSFQLLTPGKKVIVNEFL
jgi:hypothetical protein